MARHTIEILHGDNPSRSFVALLALALVAGLAAGCSPSAKKARHLERADKYYEAGRYEPAEIEYQNVRQLDPTNPRAIVRLGLIYYEQGRIGAAYAYLLRAREAEPQNLEVRFKMGYIHLALNQTKEAFNEASFVLEHSPDHAEAPLLLAETVRTLEEIEPMHQRLERLTEQTGKSAPILLALATLYFRQGDLAAAEAACQSALALDPKSGAGHFLLGNLFWARKELEGAEREFKAAADLSPVRSLRRMKYADFKMQTGNLPAAKQVLEEITGRARDFLPAWIRLAEIALTQQDYKTCAALLKEALARDPANYETLLLSGNLRLAQGDGAGAIRDFDRVLALYGRSPHAHYHLAAAHLLNNDPTKAIRSLNQAVALAPDFDEAVLLLARLQLKRGDHASAISGLSQLARRKPRDVQANVLLAEAYRARGQLEDALAVCRRLEQSDPQNSVAPLLRGAMLVQQNKRDEGRLAFEKVLSLTPGFLPALEQLVDLDVADHQYARALNRMRTELAARADSPQLYFLLSKIFLAQRDVPRTESALLKAIELDPGYTTAYLLLARVYVESNQFEKALERLGTIVAKHPEDVPALIMTGMIQMELKNFPAARSAYERTLAADPNHGPALNNLAYLYAEEFGMLDEAYDAARKARQLLPDSPHAADTLGWILYKRGEYQRALGLLTESAQKLADMPDAQFRLGMTYYMLGDERRAESALKSAVAMNRDFRGKEEAERRLALLATDGRTASPEALLRVEQRLKQQPNDPIALARLDARYESQGTPELAVNAFERALKETPENITVLTRLAWLYRRSNNSSKAMEMAREAYRLTPGDPEVSRILGLLVFDARDHKWAVSLLEQSVRTTAPDAERHYDLGLAHYSVGRIADAQAGVKKALENSASFSRAEEARRFLNLVELAATPATAAQASAVVGPILKANPANVPARMVAGRAAEHRGEIQIARTEYEQVLRVYPDFTPAKKRLAILYLEAPADDAKAYQMALQARAVFPNDAEVGRAMGIVLYRRGDFRGSTGYLDQSLRKEENGPAMFYLGMAYYHLKETEKSKTALRRALELKLGNEWTEEAKKALADLD